MWRKRKQWRQSHLFFTIALESIDLQISVSDWKIPAKLSEHSRRAQKQIIPKCFFKRQLEYSSYQCGFFWGGKDQFEKKPLSNLFFTADQSYFNGMLHLQKALLFLLKCQIKPEDHLSHNSILKAPYCTFLNAATFLLRNYHIQKRCC